MGNRIGWWKQKNAPKEVSEETLIERHKKWSNDKIEALQFEVDLYKRWSDHYHREVVVLNGVVRRKSARIKRLVQVIRDLKAKTP